MNWISNIDAAFSERLCMTLLHTAWQAAALVAVALVAERLFCQRSVNRRYAVNVVALVAVVLLAPVTYAMLDTTSQSDSAISAVPQLAAEVTPVGSRTKTLPSESVFPATLDNSRPQTATTLNAKLAGEAADLAAPPTGLMDSVLATTAASAHIDHAASITPTPKRLGPMRAFAPWVVVSYLALVVSMLGRLILSVRQAHRLVNQSTCLTDGPLYRLLRSLVGLPERAAPALAQSDRIVVPTLVGIARPTILLPVAAVSGMTTSELELILAHEIAHIRRYDLWINLVQRLAEAVLFFNPFVWILSRRISTLREYCCDEAVCNERSRERAEPRIRYAAALLRIVELARPSLVGGPQLAALSAAGRSPSELRRRVACLFGEPIREPLRIPRLGLAAIVIAGAAVAIGLPAWHVASNAAVVQDQEATQGFDDPFEFALKVVGPDGAPVSGAEIQIRSAAPTAQQIVHGEFVRNATYGPFVKTDDQGRLSFTLQEQPGSLTLSIRTPGFAPYWAAWSSGNSEEIPTEFTAELDAGWMVGGVVVDQQGNPVKDVLIDPDTRYKMRPGDMGALGVGSYIKTDEQGKWRFEHAPVSESDVHFTFTHPDFKQVRQRLPRNGFEIKPGEEPNGKIAMDPGLSVTGRITDEAGAPIVGALVRTKFINDLRQAETNERGEYRLTGCEEMVTRIVVSAPGKAIDLQTVRVEPGMPPVDFNMKPGHTIKIRVLDEEGNGIPQTRIFFQQWRGQIDYFEFRHLNDRTDENGVWEWNEAPPDLILADICRPGGMQLPEQPITARDEEYVFKPPQLLAVSGKVIDAGTKQPLSSFRVVPGYLQVGLAGNHVQWIQRESFVASDGQFRLTRSRPMNEFRVRIEADGYKVANSEVIDSEKGGEVTVDFELEPAAVMNSRIITPTSGPAKDAMIIMGAPGARFRVRNGAIETTPGETALVADENGQFTLTARDEPYEMLITHSDGFAFFEAERGQLPEEILLTAWARVVGTYRIGEERAPFVNLTLNGSALVASGANTISVSPQYSTTTGANGDYEFPRVFPGHANIGREIIRIVDQGATEVTSAVFKPVKLTAGQITIADIGGTGRPVVGRLLQPEGRTEPLDWKFATIYLTVDLQRPPAAPDPPPQIDNNPAARAAWWSAWFETEEGQAWQKANDEFNEARLNSPRVHATVNRDGTFRMDDVPPGDYEFEVSVSRNGFGRGKIEIKVAVPEVEGGGVGEAVDLGDLEID